MRLRNKKTGKVTKLDIHCIAGKNYDSLAEINAEWEDYEEPKEHYFITEYGEVFSLNEYEGLNNVANPEDYKSIGNYFSSREEAERAVEKLKAWKRLKDKGFEFCCDIKYENLCGNGFNISLNAIMPPEAYVDIEVSKDLDLLFGGEK